jgi:hypothetical protein
MPHHHRHHRLIASAATMLLSACGGVPVTTAEAPCPAPSATPAPAKSRPVLATKPTAAQSPKPTAAATTARPATKSSPAASPAARPAPKAAVLLDAAAMAADMQQAMAGMTAYDAVVTATDFRSDGKATTKTTTQIRYQAPGSYRMDVQTSTMPMAAGSKTLLTIGSPNVQVKAGGILGLATLTLPLKDERVASLNHWTPDNLLSHPVVRRAMASEGTWRVAGTATVAGTPVTILELTTPANALDPAIAYERFGIDSDHHLRLWACYGGPETKAADGLLYQFTVAHRTVNPSLPAGLFAF